jgi:hypothetical protein
MTPIAARFLKGTVRCSPCAVCTFAQTRLPFWRGIAPSKGDQYDHDRAGVPANARQCLSWAESASDPENREAFFALAATWESAAARIEKSTAAPGITASRQSQLRIDVTSSDAVLAGRAQTLQDARKPMHT